MVIMSKIDKLARNLLYISVFLIPFYFFRFKIFGLPTNVLEISIGLLFIVTLISLISNKQKINFGTWWYYLLVLMAFANILLADDKVKALGIAKGWFLFPALLYFAIINLVKKKDLPKLTFPIFISLMIVSIWAIFQKLGLITTLFYQAEDQTFSQYLVGNFRVYGPFESPNYLAMYLVPTMFLTIIGWQSIKNNSLRVILALAYILPLLALYSSGSRAGILAFGVSVFAYAFWAEKRRIGSVIVTWGLLFMVILAVGLFFYKYGFNPASDNIRLEIYRYAWQITKSNPVLGIGLGNFQIKIAEVTANALDFKTHALPYAIHPHNIFLAFWLNLGLVGLGIFVLMIGKFLLSLKKISKKNMIQGVLLMTMVAILVHGLFDTPYFKNDLSTTFWLILAFSGIASNFNQLEKVTFLGIDRK